MGKFCGKCGAKLEGNATVCPMCNAVVEEAPASEVKEEIKEETKEEVKEEAVEVKPETVKSTTTGSSIGTEIDKAIGSAKEKGGEFIKKMKTDKKFSQLVIAIAAGVVAAVAVVVVLACLIFGGGYTEAIDNYIDLISGDADAIEKMIPPAALEYMVDEEDFDLDEFKEEYEDTSDERMEYLEEEYGEDIKISYEITKEKELSEKKLNAIRDGLKENYDIQKKSVTKGYELDVEMTIEGDDDEDTDEDEIIVVKIDGDWYITTSRGSLSFF